MTVDEARLVLGALDTLAVSLTDKTHEWTEGERAIYEQATAIVADVIEPMESNDYEI